MRVIKYTGTRTNKQNNQNTTPVASYEAIQGHRKTLHRNNLSLETVEPEQTVCISQNLTSKYVNRCMYTMELAVLLIPKQHCPRKVAGDLKENFVYNNRQTKNALAFAYPIFRLILHAS
jgi:hypothetical protein